MAPKKRPTRFLTSFTYSKKLPTYLYAKYSACTNTESSNTLQTCHILGRHTNAPVTPAHSSHTYSNMTPPASRLYSKKLRPSGISAAATRTVRQTIATKVRLYHERLRSASHFTTTATVLQTETCLQDIFRTAPEGRASFFVRPAQTNSVPPAISKTRTL